MIPTKKHELDVTSTLEGREIGMTIDENSLQHIMAVLTDLYSDPLLAVVREYSTNARDAHIAAGKDDDPIEVYTPTALSPSLRVIDHGVGLSESDIEDIYSKYGASTKTTSNDFNGVLGLGCKSALTYTSQFTVVGTKDGIRTTVSVSRDEEGVGTMKVLNTTETDDDNGVEIQIAIKQNDRDDVLLKAQEFFRYWPEGTVLLNSKEPERLEGMPIGENLILESYTYDYYARDKYPNLLVMGGVAYPLENPNYETEMNFNLPDGFRLVAYVPNGAVHFTPSREALNYTTRTKEVVKQLKATFKTDLEAAVTKEIEAQETKHAAVQAAIKWLEVLPTHLRGSKFTYKGLDLPQEITADSVSGGPTETWIVTDGKEHKSWLGKRERVGAHSHSKAIAIGTVPNTIFVTDFDRTFTPTVKHKLWEWCHQQKREYPGYFVMTKGAPTSPWVDPNQVISWPNDVEPIKLPRYQNVQRSTGTTTRRLKGSYDLYEDGVARWEVPADDIQKMVDDGKTLFYSSGAGGGYSYAEWLTTLMDDTVLVCFSTRREDKFLRTFKDAQAIWPFLCEAASWICSQFTEYELQVIAYHQRYQHSANYKWLNWTIKDPEVRKLMSLRDFDSDLVQKLMDRWRFVNRFTTCDLPKIDNPLSKYPLACNHYGHRRDLSTKHLLLYMNMIYEMEQSSNA